MKNTSVALCAVILCGCASTGLPPEVKSQLAPTGELRVAVLTSNPIIHRTTPDLGRELAAHAGVPLKLIEYGAVNRLMEDAAKGAWDVTVVAIDPERRAAARGLVRRAAPRVRRAEEPAGGRAPCGAVRRGSEELGRRAARDRGRRAAG